MCAHNKRKTLLTCMPAKTNKPTTTNSRTHMQMHSIQMVSKKGVKSVFVLVYCRHRTPSTVTTVATGAAAAAMCFVIFV